MVRDQLRRRGITDAATLAAMGSVPREFFVPAARKDDAYADSALSIGGGQTISQPYMVARMTELLALGETAVEAPPERPRVLDVGTGSGYQAAVLSQMGADVVSVERDARLAAEARTRLLALGYAVDVVVADGGGGFPPAAPYAGVVVAAAVPQVPPALFEQLADRARLVIPVGTRSSQRLTVIRRMGADLETSLADACVFVPLIGPHGFAC
jgi:protein-L-isoaspartate(D-aspartate) O-methyltransferase